MPSVSEVISKTIRKHGRDRCNLLPILQELVTQRNYLTPELLLELSKATEIPSAHIYGVASFYSFLPCSRHGQHIIRICHNISCYMSKKDNIIAALEERLKIKLGETTPDDKFTLLTTNCMGWCHKGPAMLINNDVYTELTPNGAVSIIEKLL